MRDGKAVSNLGGKALGEPPLGTGRRWVTLLSPSPRRNSARTSRARRSRSIIECYGVRILACVAFVLSVVRVGIVSAQNTAPWGSESIRAAYAR